MKKIISSFTPLGGQHCITNSLKQVFTHNGYSLSEEMMFGLASGLSFLYINQEKSPMINGRTKVFEFEKKLAQRLNINIQCKAGKDYQKTFNQIKTIIDQDQSVLVYVDMAYLTYLDMDADSHFGGHAVVVYGYDDENKIVWISDRDNHDYSIRSPKGKINMDYHLVSYEEFMKARSSSFRPFPAKNKYLVFDFSTYQAITPSILREAIQETCESMLNPPAHLLGIEGIHKFSKEILKWNKFSNDKLRIAGITNYFQISKDGGTGGGIFRKMYGNFLIESSYILENDRILEIGKQFLIISDSWDDIANDLWELSESLHTDLLKIISNKVQTLYNKEKELYFSLYNAFL